MVKRLPEMQETSVQVLGLEDLLEKEMATHSSILAQKIPWTEDPGGLKFMGSKELETTERLHFLSFLSSGCSTMFLSAMLCSLSFWKDVIHIYV